ncbi:uncharacterized protein LOC120713783 [Panicum virgatum]|uniref:Uncharacterized protein n=1 Tax=Panicum virgatum TaxID=38727 RepID=A0A8T0RM04_PANVG|nr:uncharacterized protein LOC120713783 [Panicum virgatum]KAG2585609.1 hypothetical protein PVAP13_6KG401700 [Panicum virgatum]
MEAEIVKPPPPAPVSMSSSSVSASAGPAGAVGGEFTADDLAAADQLVQLSVSGGGDEEEDQHEAFSSSSSPRSVNNAARGEEEEEDHEDYSGVVDRRARKRYRLVSELYAATRQVKAGAGGKTKRKSSKDGMRN